MCRSKDIGLKIEDALDSWLAASKLSGASGCPGLSYRDPWIILLLCPGLGCCYSTWNVELTDPGAPRALGPVEGQSSAEHHCWGKPRAAGTEGHLKNAKPEGSMVTVGLRHFLGP